MKFLFALIVIAASHTFALSQETSDQYIRAEKEFRLDGDTAPSGRIVLREAVTSLPVFSFQPQTEGVVALDLMPKGSPSQFGNNGYSWFDACDTDIAEGTGMASVNCGRLGINDTAVWIGSMVFGAAMPKPVEMIVGSVPKVLFDFTKNVFEETVLIGTENLSPGVSNGSIGISLTKQGTAYVSRDGFPALILNRKQSGQVIQLRRAGDVVGTITVESDGVTLSGFKQIDDLMARVEALEAAAN